MSVDCTAAERYVRGVLGMCKAACIKNCKTTLDIKDVEAALSPIPCKTRRTRVHVRRVIQPLLVESKMRIQMRALGLLAIASTQFKMSDDDVVTAIHAMINNCKADGRSIIKAQHVLDELPSA